MINGKTRRAIFCETVFRRCLFALVFVPLPVAFAQPVAAPLLEESTGPIGELIVTIDEAALAEWCESQGLPSPPLISEVDAFSYRILHSAILRTQIADSSEGIGGLGMVYEANGFLKRARACYELATERFSAEAKWSYRLGVVLEKMGQVDRAATELGKLIEFDPNYAAGIVRLGDLLVQAQTYPAAERLFRRYVAMRPDDGAGYFGLGRIALVNGQYDQAATQLQLAIRYNPTDRRAMLLLSQAYRRLGRHEESGAMLDHARELGDQSVASGINDPTDESMAKLARSNLLLESFLNRLIDEGDLEGALTAGVQLFKRRPDDYETMRQCAMICVGIGSNRLAQALQFANQSVIVKEDFAPGHAVRADVLRSIGHQEDAMESARRAVELDPESPDAHAAVGSVLYVDGKFTEAASSFEQAVKLSPESAKNRILLAGAYRALNRRDDAIALLTETLQKHPSHTGALGLLREIRLEP
jgi:tetratricopeptide (TPR) repeat protein